jgi:hypothetical protein
MTCTYLQCFHLHTRKLLKVFLAFPALVIFGTFRIQNVKQKIVQAYCHLTWIRDYKCLITIKPKLSLSVETVNMETQTYIKFL